MLKSRLPQIAVEIDIVVDEALERGAENVAHAAQVRVPVDTGKLRDAIHVESEREGKYVVAGDGGEVFYGHMVEHGTTRQPPRPFLVPALEESRNEVVNIVSVALRRL
jgi:HK97 gp10 family phage protein